MSQSSPVRGFDTETYHADADPTAKSSASLMACGMETYSEQLFATMKQARL